MTIRSFNVILLKDSINYLESECKSGGSQYKKTDLTPRLVTGQEEEWSETEKPPTEQKFKSECKKGELTSI